jgi:NAD(P)-dependent dehydrogenase (short-subunit alcohol dehydrogenase family)
MKLLGKTALVTGAARGIGHGCALELARALNSHDAYKLVFACHS